jgi:hypothetical protein
MNIDDTVQLMRMEYAEFPGLKLTFWQAQRLWRLSEEDCAAALNRLVASSFLTRTAGGAYTRAGWATARFTSAAPQGSPRAFA